MKIMSLRPRVIYRLERFVVIKCGTFYHFLRKDERGKHRGLGSKSY